MLRSKVSTSVVQAALLLGMVSLTGCGSNHSADNNTVHTNSAGGNNGSRIQTNAVRGNTYDKMEMSQELAKRVSDMPEVSSANVMLAGKSAYVAVKLDETNGKPRDLSTHHYRSYSYDVGNLTSLLPRSGGNMRGGAGGMDAGNMTGRTGGMDSGAGVTGRGSAAGTPGVTGMGGSMAGVPADLTGTGTTGGTGVANPQGYTEAGMTGGNGALFGSNYTDGTRMKRDIDDSLGSGIGIRSVAPDNNYRMSGNEDVTKDMKDRIASVVKKHNPAIKNVYVSANPDFVERANYYAEEARAGHPLKGFAKEFGTMVERIFPAHSGY
ncbi:Lipoprotein YhcN precursor [compost metagenome]